jgi:hypoxanthine phosphoribosyltransferase
VVDQIDGLATASAASRMLAAPGEGTSEPTEGVTSAVDATRFAHASEAEMARILDFYDVRWEYEPTTFPILWNLDGDVVESFAPDFYLPEIDMFLEMTTLKQRLVRKKNRKLRRLRELYPDVRIKLFYARDFRAMMLKYGRFALAESLSGTTGQVVPERAALEVPSDEEPRGTEAAPAPLPSVLVQATPVPAPAARPSPRRSRPARRRVPGAARTGARRDREARK